MANNTAEMLHNIHNWVDDVFEGFEAVIDDVEESNESYCMTCVADDYTNAQASKLLAEALKHCKEDPEAALDFLNYRRVSFLAHAQILNDLMIAVEDMCMDDLST